MSPSRPANGESLATKSICKVGGSILRNGNASGSSADAIVSPTKISLIPLIAIISPALASVISLRFKPKKPNSLVTRKFCFEPSRFITVMLSPTFTLPR